jgi:signal transduction histidine kinase
VRGLLGEQAAAKGVRLSVPDIDNDVTCSADAGQITQVLLNVVLNAIQACESGDEVSVSCNLAGSPLNGPRTAHIEVVDTGAGVPSAVRDNLFDPFVTTKTRGTGLGLAISQHIIEEHDGTIRCEFLERGTRFSIELPYVETPTSSARATR